MKKHICEKCEHEKECRNMVCFYELLEKEEKKIRADEREKFAHELKERLNEEFPSNYPSTKPFFTLENVRMIVDEVVEEQSINQ